MKARILRGHPGDSTITIELVEADGSRRNEIVVEGVEIEVVPAMNDFGRGRFITPGQVEALYSLGQYVAAVNKVRDLEIWLEDVRLNSVIAAIGLTTFKVVVGLLTNSLGILAEAGHSALDLVATGMTFFAVRVSDRPPDREHPFGHGKVESVSALFETLLLLATSGWRKPDWHLVPDAAKGSIFLLCLVLCASMMPVEKLPAASWPSTLGLGFISAVFDNIPLTALALKQGGYDWGMLAYAVGFGVSMIWFGSSAGVWSTLLPTSENPTASSR